MQRGLVETDCDLETALSADPLRQRSDASWILPLCLTLLYAALIWLQIGRHLWFDELLTYHLANASSLGRLFRLVERWDLNPPLLHLLAHASLRFTGGIPVAIRFPSVIEFYFASLLLFWYTARKLAWSYASLPILMLWVSPIFQYATEGRPYALLCFWFCCLLLLWDIAVTEKHTRSVIAGVAFATLGLLNSHVIAPLSLLPFLIAELVRYIRSKKPDYALWAALVLPLVSVFIYLPFYRTFEGVSYYPVAFQASLGKAVSFYWHTCSSVFLFVAVAALSGWLYLRIKPDRKGSYGANSSPLRISEWVLFSVLTVAPLLLDFIMMSKHAPFWGRYCITSVLGIYFLFALFSARLLRYSSRAGFVATSVAALLLLTLRIVLPAYNAVAHPVPSNVARFEGINPGLPIVVASGLTFVEMGQYESPQLVSRLFYLQDREAAIRFAHATLFEDFRDFQRDLKFPGTIEPYARFLTAHRHFLVFGTFDYPEDWLLRKLAADGANITRVGIFATPYKDKTLYDVQLPGISKL